MQYVSALRGKNFAETGSLTLPPPAAQAPGFELSTGGGATPCSCWLSFFEHDRTRTAANAARWLRGMIKRQLLGSRVVPTRAELACSRPGGAPILAGRQHPLVFTAHVFPHTRTDTFCVVPQPLLPSN